MMTYRLLLKKGAELLRTAGIEDYEFDAFQLLLFTTGLTKDEVFLIFDNSASDEQADNFFACVERRKNYEPLQYIIGQWSFYESDFFVGKGVLIPRPETEELVEHCCSFIKKHNVKIVYDLCTGSGCIGLSIAKKFPYVHCYLFDLFDDALFYAEKNRNNLSLNNVTIIKKDITTKLSVELPDADIIVSNPPYIESEEIRFLQHEVLNEPASALDGGEDGLAFYRAIDCIWLNKLKKNGMIAVECGENQTVDIINIFADKCNCKAVYDLYNADRFVIGLRK